jgi:hypothetical protein
VECCRLKHFHIPGLPILLEGVDDFDQHEEFWVESLKA